MVCMALLIHLSYRVNLIIGLIILFGHNLTDLARLGPEDAFYAAWGILRQSIFFNISESSVLWVPYPLLPWLGIMLLGYCLGKLYTDFSPEKRQKLLLQLGLAAVALFIILRFINVYGDPAPWSSQKNSVFTLMSFLNTTKYPISLLYALMTLGPMLVILSRLEKVNLSLLKPFAVFGRVPLFYYLIHFYLIHAASILLFMNKTGRSFSELDFHFNRGFGGITPEGGYTLFWTYAAWFVLVIALYPVCKWYNRYKSTHQHWWLSYL